MKGEIASHFPCPDTHDWKRNCTIRLFEGMIFEMDRIPLLDTPRRFIGLGVPDDNVSIDSDRIVECCPAQKSCC